jgi:hypothetical protein
MTPGGGQRSSHMAAREPRPALPTAAREPAGASGGMAHTVRADRHDVRGLPSTRRRIRWCPPARCIHTSRDESPGGPSGRTGPRPPRTHRLPPGVWWPGSRPPRQQQNHRCGDRTGQVHPAQPQRVTGQQAGQHRASVGTSNPGRHVVHKADLAGRAAAQQPGQSPNEQAPRENGQHQHDDPPPHDR